MISVAICTRNRADVLDQTLDGLCALTPGPAWELLVCGNACTDGTESVSNRYAGRLPLRFVAEPQLGLSVARNRALAEARGDVVAFVDDDVTVAPGWLVALAEGAAAQPAAGVFGGPITPVFPRDTDPVLLPLLPRIRRGFAGLDYGREPRLLHWPEHPFGANMAFRKDATSGIRFDPSLGYRGRSLLPGEESDFIARLSQRGWDTAWLPGMALEHRISADRLSLPYLVRLTRDYAALGALERDAPDTPQIAGMPRWLVRQYLERRAAAAVARVLGRRAEYLARRLDAAQTLGLIKGARLRRVGGATVAPAH